MEYKSPYKNVNHRVFNTWCKYQVRIDTYGRGCQHACEYCYAKGLLMFRGLWNTDTPAVSNICDIYKAIKKIPINTVVRLGSMTDCFQPMESRHRITYETIKLLNQHKLNYLIVTKGALVSDDRYIDIYDKKLAHFQISITNTNDADCLKYEKASKISDRIKSIEKLHSLGFDVSIRLSPFIPGFIDFKILNSIKCNKILIEFLKVNHWIRKWFDIDYSNFTFKYGGHLNLSLDEKIRQLKNIVGFKYLTVGEYVKDHHDYFSKNVNYNMNDCCNVAMKIMYCEHKQLKLF